MNLENQSTPTSDSGVGASAPSSSSGSEGLAQSSTPANSTSSGLGEQGNSTGGDYSTLEKRFQDTQRAFHQSQSQLSEYQKKLQSLEGQVQTVDQLKNALAQGLGLAGQESQPDVFDQLASDPNYIQSLVDQRVQEALTPFQQQQQYVELEKFAANQQVAKQEYLNNLKDQYGEEFANEMSNVNDVAAAINPKIGEMRQVLNNPMLTGEQKAQIQGELNQLEIQAIQQVGGIQNLQKIKLADFVLNNMDALGQQYYEMKQKKERNYGNASGFGQNGTNGAGTYNSGSGDSGFSVTSVRR